MCWKKTESKELSHDLVQVTLSGSNLLAAEYAGIYLKNKYNNEYFKLGTEGFHTLCPIVSADKKREGWGFKKHVSNYDYISMSETDYAVYASPFKNGYADSTLTVSKYVNPQRQKDTQRQIKTVSIKSAVSEITKRLKDQTVKKQTQKKQKAKQNTSHEKFDFSEKISPPILRQTLKNNGLYKEKDKTVNIEWSETQYSGYRLEIFREENGEYKSYAYDLQENKFSFEPQGGNYFFRVKSFINEDGKYTHGPYSENMQFTKLYPGDCIEENITVHLDTYEDKNIYVKINGTWYGTGTKYGEPVSIVNFPCPFTVEEIDFENNPRFIKFRLNKNSSKIIHNIDVEKYNKSEINQKISNLKVNEGMIISCKHR